MTAPTITGSRFELEEDEEAVVAAVSSTDITVFSGDGEAVVAAVSSTDITVISK